MDEGIIEFFRLACACRGGILTAMDVIGMTFGLFGFIFSLIAWQKVAKLEAELKRRKIIE
jgi:hypothetical protein